MKKRGLCALLMAVMLAACTADALAEGTESCETHSWSNGVCTVCGYACGHQWQAATCTEPKTCGVCGETDGEANGHRWSDGVCSDCGAACPGHDYQQTGSTSETSYEQWNDTQHKAKIAYFKMMTCSTCGHSTQESGGEQEELQNHAWEDGKCTSCGYVCQHPFKLLTYNDKKSWEEELPSVPENESTHTDHFIIHDVFDCACGLEFKPLAEPNSAAGKAHTFDGNDVCTACGYKKGDIVCDHVWTDATCTTPKTCSICGVTEGEALGHDWKDATCTESKTCSVCGETEGEEKGHSWKEATCTEPKTCSVCGEAEGEANGHSWKDATCTEPRTCRVCGETEGEAKGHSWQEATCTEPKTCSVCGETEGNANGHSWQEATCTTPKTCSVCGETDGEAKGHSWQEATCTEPKTCGVCGETDGEANGHRWSDGVCSDCGAACPGHDYQQTGSTSETSYEQWNDTQHKAKIAYFKTMTCSTCGHSIQESGGEQDEYQNHEWADGKCTSCGYVCQHPFKLLTYNDKKSWEEELPSVPENESTHTDHFIIHDVFDCACGLEFKPLAEPNSAAGKAHTFDENDVCTACGYKKGDVVCDHEWTEATCTTPKTCSKCGTTVGEAKGHSWSDGVCGVCGETCSHEWNAATCTAAKTCGICGVTEGEALGHDWKDATCTEPKTCGRCGVTEGEAKGHSWKDATCTEPKTCEVCGETEGSALGHGWKDATCTEPKTCEVCGVTEGEAKGHSWKDATCTEPKTCETCGVTEGEAKGHSWKDATCTEPKTCEACGVTEGSALGHSWSDGVCTVCGYGCSHDWSDQNGVCRLCNEACQHPEAMRILNDDECWDDFVTATADDDATHTYSYTHHDVYDCTCGIKEVYDDAYDVTIPGQPHEYVNGECEECGHVCQHPFSMLTYNAEKSWDEPLPSVADDDSTHTDHYIIHDVFDCACGKEFAAPASEGSASGKPHSYTDGVCADCGHVCTHSSVETDGDLIRTDGEAEYVNEEVHIQHYTYEQMMKCALCGSKVQSLSGSGRDGSVLHVYVNDVCVCGAKKPAAPSDDDDSTGGGSTGGNGGNGGGNYTGAVQEPETDEELVFEQTEQAPKPAMVEKLVETIAEAEASGSEVKVEVVGAQQVMTETEYEQLKTLPAQEQVLVTLASIGFEEVVSAAVETMSDVALSDDALKLMDTVSARMTEMSAEEREQMQAKLTEYFPMREIEVGGVTYPYFVMELQVEVDGVLTIQRYGFRMDENGEWIFVVLSEQ